MFDVTFRLNPIFQITPVGDLTEKQRKKFEYITKNREIHGLLHAPSDAKVTVKALNRPMVVFLMQFREPRKLSDVPADFFEGPAADIQNLIIRLVLDSVLEIRHDGDFISGVEAVNKVLLATGKTEGVETAPEMNQTQALSMEAIRLALRLPAKHPMVVSNFLYSYNSLPLCRKCRSRFPGEEAIAGFLGLDGNGTWPGMPRSVRPKKVERDADGTIRTYDQVWRYWYLSRRPESADRLNFKIYVSPSLDDLPGAFGTVREAVIGSGAYSMKIGRRVTELFRPDKLVIYFVSYEEARDFAVKLAERIGPLHAQGVPFTYQVSPADPIVSMGVDPPKKFGEKNSWRRYITDNLALAIQSASRSGSRSPLEYIQKQLRVLGIDVGEWCPLRGDWSVEFDLKETSA